MDTRPAIRLRQGRTQAEVLGVLVKSQMGGRRKYFAYTYTQIPFILSYFFYCLRSNCTPIKGCEGGPPVASPPLVKPPAKPARYIGKNVENKSAGPTNFIIVPKFPHEAYESNRYK